MLAPIEEIFCEIDDFCKAYLTEESKYLLPNPNRQRARRCGLAVSEIMTIEVLFHMSHYRTFKDFYHECVMRHLRCYFPNLVSYNRFIELKQYSIIPLSMFSLSKSGKETGLYYVDATALKVCHNKRIPRHKVFAGIVERGKTSMGWFFGFKLHLVMNDCGEIVRFCLTKGNTDDREPLLQLFKGLQGYAFGDKGYISKEKEEKLREQGLHLITKVRKNMKTKLLSLWEKFYLGQRNLIETLIDILKNIYQIEHSRHRKPDNFLANLLAALVAYAFRPRKLTVKQPYRIQQSQYALTSN